LEHEFMLPSGPGAGASPESARPHVLVIEPSRVLAARLREVCLRRGLRTRIARDVPTALESVCAARPTAVITALELPGLPGTSLIAALRSAPHCRAIPIVLITATKPQVSPGRDAPDLVLPKDHELLAALDRFLVARGIATTPSPPRVPRGARVLLAEDTATLRKLVCRWLQAVDIEVTAVENGVEAVRAAAAGAFDLILMDVEMPELDGWSATRRLRAQGVQTPVIAFTAHEGDGVRRLALAAGCADVLPKPVSREALLSACALHARATLVGK
jgi:CheY-like chemotaxis protein